MSSSLDEIRKRWTGVAWSGEQWSQNDITTLLAAVNALTAERDEWQATAEVLSNESLAIKMIAAERDAAQARVEEYAELERAARYAKDVIRLVLTFPKACDGEAQLRRLADDIEAALANLGKEAKPDA